MKRSDFLKSLGVVIVAPSVFISTKEGVLKEIPTSNLKLKRYPIYPDRNQWSFFNAKWNIMEHNAFAYVKINRDNKDYLVLVRESHLGESVNKLNDRFDYQCEQVNKYYQVSEANQFCGQVEYNPTIHHD